MIIGLDKVIEFLDENHCQEWQVRTVSDKENFLFRSEDGESRDQRMNRFKTVMALVENDKMYLEAWVTPKSTKNWFRDWFRLSLAQSNGNVSQIGSVANSQSISDQVAAAVGAAMMERDFRDLREKYSELEKEYDSLEEEHNAVKTKIFKHVEPFVPAIIGHLASKFIPQATEIAVAGLTTDKTFEADRLQAVCTRLERLDPNYIEILEELASLGERKPEMIAMAKNLLKTL